MEKYIVDTSAILHNSKVVDEIKDSLILIPIEVLKELDAHKYDGGTTGLNARSFARYLDSLAGMGSLEDGVKLDSGSILQVLHGFKLSGCADEAILAVNVNDGPFTVVTDDIYLRVMAASKGFKTLSCDAIFGDAQIYKGFRQIDVLQTELDQIYLEKKAYFEGLYPNEFVIIKSEYGRCAYGRFHKNLGHVVLINGHSPKLQASVQPKNVYQKFLVDAILDPDISIVMAHSLAGCGKTLISLAAALYMVRVKKLYQQLVISKSIAAVGGDRLGFLPGSLEEKMKYWVLNYSDNLSLLQQEDLFECPDINVCTTMHMRGRSINNSIVVVDECIGGEEYVTTENGKIKLRLLHKAFQNGKILPKLRTWNETSEEFETKAIVSVTDKGERSTVKILAGNRSIVCTPEHKFLTESGWKAAKDLSSYTPLISEPSNRLQTLPVLNEDQLQVVYGSYLGDGHVDIIGPNRQRLVVIHGIKQKEYCSWKASLFGADLDKIEKNGYAGTPAYRFTTKCFALRQEVGNKTSCPQWILDAIDLRGIAIWYMDDGSIDKTKKCIRLFTNSFDLDSQERFVLKLRSFGIVAHISIDEGVCDGESYKYFYLRIGVDESRKLLKLIAPYIHPSMSFKTETIATECYGWNKEYLDHRNVIVDAVVPFIKNKVFDIEVEGNHNFIITSKSRDKRYSESTGVVVHNCQNFTPSEAKTIVTRIGDHSKIICLGDVTQIDNHGLNIYNNGLTYIVNRFKGHEIAATISLEENERSEISKLAASIL